MGVAADLWEGIAGICCHSKARSGQSQSYDPLQGESVWPAAAPPVLHTASRGKRDAKGRCKCDSGGARKDRNLYRRETERAKKDGNWGWGGGERGKGGEKKKEERRKRRRRKRREERGE